MGQGGFRRRPEMAPTRAGGVVVTVRKRASASGERAPQSDRGPGISQTDVADHNSRAALEILRATGPRTRQALSERLGLTPPAITGIMRRLTDAGLVAEHRRAADGRTPAAEFSLRPGGALAVGIAAAPEGVHAVLADLSGTVVAETCRAGPDAPATAVADLLAGSPRGSVAGIGIARHPDVAPDVAALAAACPDLPLFLVPDTVAAVTAERMLGAGEPEGGLVVVVIDGTVRAGLSIGGRPFRGTHGRAGAIGAMRTGPDRRPLNEIATASVLARRLAGVAAGNRDATLSAWIAEAATHLLDAVVTVSGFLAPGAIVIGGALDDAVVRRLIDAMQSERADVSRRPVALPWLSPLRPASLPGAGLALGAALVPFLEFHLPKPAGFPSERLAPPAP